MQRLGPLNGNPKDVSHPETHYLTWGSGSCPLSSGSRRDHRNLLPPPKLRYHENFPSTNACTSSSMDISTDNREAKHATRKLGVNFHACTKWFNHAKVHKGVHEISITPPKFAYITRTNFSIEMEVQKSQRLYDASHRLPTCVSVHATHDAHTHCLLSLSALQYAVRARVGCAAY